VAQSLWDRIKDTKTSSAEQLVADFLSDADDTPALKAGEHYVQLYVSDLFLAEDRQWFADRWPAVHVSVRLRYAGRDMRTFSAVAAPSQGMRGPGVRRNYEITPLLPFQGESMEIEAGLSALRGDNGVGTAIHVLQGFSSLIAPPLGVALDIAQKVVAGLEELIEASGGDVVLALHDTLSEEGGGGDSVLRPGYMAVVGAPTGTFGDGELTVADDRLNRRRNGTVEPLTGYDYLLLRLEARGHRAAWRSQEFDDMIRRAVEARLSRRSDEFEAWRAAVLTRALTSPDLIRVDQQRVARAIDEELEQVARFGRGARGAKVRGLSDIMAARAKPVDTIMAMPPMTLAEVAGERRGGRVIA
jgi:hypothetical protein